MKTKLTLKLFTLCVLTVGLCLPAFAQYISYNFTVTTAADGSSITLTNVYIIDVEPGEAYAFITPVVWTNGQTAWTSGSQIGGNVRSTYSGTNYLILIAVYTDATDNTNGVAISLPSSLATNYMSSGETWNQFNNSTNFPFGLLPDESTTLSDLQTESQNTLEYTLVYFSFNYLLPSDPIMQQPGWSGTIVAFSSAQSIGSFSFAPQPALRISSSGGAVTIQWPTNAWSFTLAQSTNLSVGPWSDVTTVPTIISNNFSVTLPAETNQFFRLHEP